MKKQFKRGLSALLAVIMLITVFTSTPFTVNAVTHEHPLTHVEKKTPTTEENGNIEYWYCEECQKYFSDADGENEITDKTSVLVPYFTFGYDGDFLKLIRYNGNDEEVTVPETVPANYPDETLCNQSFSIIKESAFIDNTTITKVTMFDNIGHIAASCFANCSALTEVRIGTGLTYLGRSCFYNCKALKKIRILSNDNDFDMDTYAISVSDCPNAVVYGYSDTALERKMTAAGVPFVPIDHKLRHVDKVFPTSRKNGNIEYWYYSDTDKYYTDAQTTKEIPFKDTVLPYFSFEYSSDRFYKLTGYNGDDVYVSLPETIPDIYPDKSLRGKTVTVIREEAFKDNSTIEKVTIPDSYTHVGIDSFNGCANLKTVTIGKGLDYLEQRCFADCPKLEKVYIDSKREDFGMNPFAFGSNSNATVYGYHNTKVEELMKSNSVPFVAREHTYGDPAWSWSEDCSSATATFTCEFCDDAKTVNAAITSEITEATCTKDGEAKYTATVTFEEQTYTDEKTTVLTKRHTLTYVEKKFPTQAENGNIAYWYCPKCDKYYADEQGTEELTQAQTLLPYFSFEYSSDGYYKLTGYNGSDENITIPEKIPGNYPDGALCGKDFSIIKEFAFFKNSILKNVVMQDNIGHIGRSAFIKCENLEEVVIGTNLSYLASDCFSECPKLSKVVIYSKDDDFSIEKSNTLFLSSPNVTVYGYHETEVEKAMQKISGIKFEPLEHIYGEPVWTWTETDDGWAAEVKLVCTSDDSTLSAAADVTLIETLEPTCTAAGRKTYEARGEINGAAYMATKTVEIEKLPHAYSEWTWNWHDDNTASVSHECTVCHETEEHQAHIVVAAGIPASCGENGSKTYLAYITIDGEYMSDYKTVEIPKTGSHTFAEPAWNWESDYSGADAVFTCSVCGETHTEHAAVVTLVVKEATYTEKGLRKHTATADFEGKTYTDEVTEEFSGDFAARIGDTGYKTFAEAAQAAKGKKDIVLLRDMDSAFDIQSHNADVLRVNADGYKVNIKNYVRIENKKNVTYYYKKDAVAYVDGDAAKVTAGTIAIAAGTAASILWNGTAAEAATTTMVIGAGAEAIIDGGINDSQLEPENPDEECLEEEEQEDGTKKVKNLKYHWVTIDTGISYLDAAADVWPDYVNNTWAIYNQNMSSIIKIAPPVLDFVGKTDVVLQIPYPEGWYFPPIPYLPEALNPGSHFVAFFEGASASSYGTPFFGKNITEDLTITGLWVPYEAAVINPDGDRAYFLTFQEAAENRSGNIVEILSAPTLRYTLKKVQDEPEVYEILRVKRGFYVGDDCVDAPPGLPDGYAKRTWTYTDGNGDVITCYTVDKALKATFVYNNGEPNSEKNIYSNQPVEEPENPVKPRSFFDGWYADENLTQPFDFTTPVYTDVTLYAKWRETPGYTVQKVWDTGSNLTLRPDSAKAVLQQLVTTEGQQTSAWQTVETLTLSEDNNWQATFNAPTDSEKQFRIRELDANENVIYVQGDEEYQEPGGSVTYAFTRDGYDYSLTYRVACTENQDGLTVITNTLADKVIQIEKKWDIDLENKDRPDSVQMLVQAKNGGKWENTQLVTLSENNGWTASVNVPGSRAKDGNVEEIEYRVRELTEESLYRQFMSTLKTLVAGGKETYDQWVQKLKTDGQSTYNALPAGIRRSMDSGYESLCRTLGVADNTVNTLYDRLMDILERESAHDRIVYDKNDSDFKADGGKVPNRVTYNVSGYNSAVTGGEVENHATAYNVKYAVDGGKTTVTNTAIQIVDMFKHWVPLGVEQEDMPDSAWLVLMCKPNVNSAEDAKSMAAAAGFDVSGLADLELPVINPLEGGNGPFYILGEAVLGSDMGWIDNTLGLPKIGIVKVTEADGWKKTIVDKKYTCGIPMTYRGAELSGEALRQIIKYLTDGAVDIPVSYNIFSNYITVSTKAIPELRWMSVDDFDMSKLIAQGKELSQQDLDNFKPQDLVFDKAKLMTHIINVKFKLEPGETEDIDWPEGNTLRGSKIWDGDEEKRPEWLKIHVWEGDREIAGSPITLNKADFAGKNLWTWQLTLDEGVNKKALTVTEEYPADFEYKDCYTPAVLGATIANKWEPDREVKGSYKFTHIDRNGDKRTKTVEVTLNEQEKKGYSGNNYNPGVPTYLWTAEAQALFDKNPLVAASLAVNGNDDDQKDVSVYKSDVEWDLLKFTADEATNMTPDSDGKSLTVLAETKSYTFTFNYYIVKDGKTEYQGTKTDVPYGKPVTFDSAYADPDKYVYINSDIPAEDFCYWSADEEGLIPITTNRTFGMLMRGKWDKDAETDRAVNVYAQYSNHLENDWNPLIEEVTFTHMIEDNNDWVYLDYMTNYLSKDGKVVQDMVAEGDENLRYGLIIVKHPVGSSNPTYMDMVARADSMIKSDSSAVRIDEETVAYRFEYGKPTDTTKPISNYNRVLYTLRSDTAKAENCTFSVIAYITVDGENYYYSDVNNDINVHELLNE